MKFALLLTPGASAPVCTFTAYTPRDLRAALCRHITDDRLYHPVVFSDAIDSLDSPTLNPWLFLRALPGPGAMRQGIKGSITLDGALRAQCTETECARLIDLARQALDHGEAIARFLRQVGCIVEDTMISA